MTVENISWSISTKECCRPRRGLNPRPGLQSDGASNWATEAGKTCCGGVDCATGAGDVCKCTEPCPCWWGVQWRVWSEGWCSPRISTRPTALHHCAWSLITRVPLWGPLGGPLCWWPCFHRWIAWGMCQEAIDLERSNGEERTESKCRKDKDHDLRFGTGPPAEFRRVSMRCLALEWAATASSAMAASTGCTRNAVGSSAWKRTLTVDVHGAKELHAPWMADHRRKSRSDLTSLRW